jgi:hypothetical protein
MLARALAYQNSGAGSKRQLKNKKLTALTQPHSNEVSLYRPAVNPSLTVSPLMPILHGLHCAVSLVISLTQSHCAVPVPIPLYHSLTVLVTINVFLQQSHCPAQLLIPLLTQSHCAVPLSIPLYSLCCPTVKLCLTQSHCAVPLLIPL